MAGRKSRTWQVSRNGARCALLDLTYPEIKDKTRINWEAQLWMFVHEMKAGDWVALPLKHRAVIAFGEVAGDYCYAPGNPPDARHIRPVKSWQEIPRNALDQDLLYSLGPR